MAHLLLVPDLLDMVTNIYHISNASWSLLNLGSEVDTSHRNDLHQTLSKFNNTHETTSHITEILTLLQVSVPRFTYHPTNHTKWSSMQTQPNVSDTDFHYLAGTG